MLPITWNPQLEKWIVQDADGKVLWRGNSYADATQFADDYLKQAAITSALQNRPIPIASVRG